MFLYDLCSKGLIDGRPRLKTYIFLRIGVLMFYFMLMMMRFLLRSFLHFVRWVPMSMITFVVLISWCADRHYKFCKGADLPSFS